MTRRRYEIPPERATREVKEQCDRGSRLFISNLDSSKITREELFHIFRKYGKIVEVSIPHVNYAFIQFIHAEDCDEAIHYEDGRHIGSRRIRLELAQGLNGRELTPRRPSSLNSSPLSGDERRDRRCRNGRRSHIRSPTHKANTRCTTINNKFNAVLGDVNSPGIIHKQRLRYSPYHTSNRDFTVPDNHLSPPVSATVSDSNTETISHISTTSNSESQPSPVNDITRAETRASAPQRSIENARPKCLVVIIGYVEPMLVEVLVLTLQSMVRRAVVTTVTIGTKPGEPLDVAKLQSICSGSIRASIFVQPKFGETATLDVRIFKKYINEDVTMEDVSHQDYMDLSIVDTVQLLQTVIEDGSQRVGLTCYPNSARTCSVPPSSHPKLHEEGSNTFLPNRPPGHVSSLHHTLVPKAEINTSSMPVIPPSANMNAFASSRFNQLTDPQNLSYRQARSNHGGDSSTLAKVGATECAYLCPSKEYLMGPLENSGKGIKI